MTAVQRRYLFVECVLGAAIINAVLNAFLGWGATWGHATFPVWKIPGVAGDYLATAYGVTFGTCIGAAVQARLDTRRGKITPPDSLSDRLSAVVSRFPNGLLARAVVLGTLSLMMIGPFILWGLYMSGQAELDRRTFIVVKAGFSAVEGAIVTPFIVLAALLDLRRAPRTS